MQAGLGAEFLAALRSNWVAAFRSDETPFANHHQLPPFDVPWTTWLLIGGRGAGKTHAGARWVRGMALGEPPYASVPTGPIALVGETEHDVREVMIEGVSGILAAHAAAERPLWIPTRRRLE